MVKGEAIMRSRCHPKETESYEIPQARRVRMDGWMPSRYRTLDAALTLAGWGYVDRGGDWTGLRWAAEQRTEGLLRALAVGSGHKVRRLSLGG